MAFAETAKLLTVLGLKDDLTPGLKKAQRGLGVFGAQLSNTQGRAYRAGQQIGTGIRNAVKIATVGVGLLATQVAAGANSLIHLEEVTTATATVLRSTKGVSGQTAAGIRDLSNEFENLNAQMDDTAIQGGANMLLTFTNVREKAFKPALLAALDMNEAMGGGPEGLQKTVIQLGKALNDPVKGITALRKVGVTFTAEQQKRIKGLVKENKLFEAQQVVLKELGTEFGGRFAAAGKTTAGKFASVGDAVEDLQRSLAKATLPALSKVATALKTALTSPQVVAGVTKLGDAIGNMFSDENLKAGAAVLTSMFETAKSVAPAIQSAAEITGRVVSTAVGLFKSLPPEIQSLAIAGLAVNKLTGGLVTNLAGGLISSVLSGFKGVLGINAGVANINAAVVNGGGGLPAAAAGAAGVGLGTAATLIGASVAATVVGSINTRSNVDRTIQSGSLAQLKVIADEARKHGVSDTNNAALQELLRRTAPVKETMRDYRESGNRAATPGSGRLGRQGGLGRDDRSYDAIEKLRGATKTGDDRSYDAIEKVRTATANAGDRSYDAIETMRNRVTTAEGATKGSVDLARAGITGAITSMAATVSAAMYGAVSMLPAPVVNVTPTTINNTSTTQQYYGKDSGSRGSAGRTGGIGAGSGGP